MVIVGHQGAPRVKELDVLQRLTAFWGKEAVSIG